MITKWWQNDDKMMTKWWQNEKITNLGISELGRDNTESGVKSIQGFLSGTQEQENHQYFPTSSMRLKLRIGFFQLLQWD